jgi:hypothetical protein
MLEVVQTSPLSEEQQTKEITFCLEKYLEELPKLTSNVEASLRSDNFNLQAQKLETANVSYPSSSLSNYLTNILEKEEKGSQSTHSSRHHPPSQESQESSTHSSFTSCHSTPECTTSPNGATQSLQLHDAQLLQHDASSTSNPSWTFQDPTQESRRKDIQQEKVNRRMSHRTKNFWKNVNLNHELEEWCSNLEKLGVAEYKIHNLTTDKLSAFEKQSLAFGINFIPKPRMNDKILRKAFLEFVRSVRLKWHFCKYGPSYSGADEDPEPSKPVSKFYIKSNWSPNPSQFNFELEDKLEKLGESIINLPKNITKNNWTTAQQKTLMNLINKPDRLIITADKNLGYVYVTTEWYEAKIFKHLHSNTYQNVTDEFTRGKDIKKMSSIYRNMNDMTLKASNCLSSEEIKFILFKRQWKPMKFYLLAKVHKQVDDPWKVEGRPIAPSMTWITHHLSIWVAVELGKYLQFATTVLKDSTTLINTLRSPKLQKAIGKKNKKIFLVSADVVALYPSINQERGVKAIHAFLKQFPEIPTQKLDFMINSLHFILKNCYIQFKEEFYWMKDGTAMGSSMCPTYANIFMFQTENYLVQQLLHKEKLLMYKRYIDDTFMIVQGTEKDVNNIMDKLNQLDETIKFTHTASKKSIDFLDIIIKYDAHLGKIDTSVFQKKLNKYAYLPWNSWHTRYMKAGFIKGEAIRYARLCSKEQDFIQTIQLFIIRLQKRGYPLNFIHKAINKVSWLYRDKYLKERSEDKKIPHIFKVEYNPIYDHRTLRTILDKFSEELVKDIKTLPSSLKEKITICYKLPPKLHKQVLKARKAKNY